EEWFVHFSRWIPKCGWNFPTRDEVLFPFHEGGFAGDVSPMWGLTPFNSHLFTFTRKDGSRGAGSFKNNLSASEPSSYSWNEGDKFAMKTVNQILGENQALRGALRVLTGETNSGKRAIYISGNPAGFRLLAEILQAQADSVGSGGGESRYFFKLERDSGSLFFATDD